MAILLRPEDVPKDLICPICLLIPTDPWILHECSHVFCGDCIKESPQYQRSKRQPTSCPVCRALCSQQRNLVPLQKVNPLAHRIWSGIAVKCDNQDCHWRGANSDYESHKNSSCCPQKETKVCHPRELPCTRTSTNTVLPNPRWNFFPFGTATNNAALQRELDKTIEENKHLKAELDKKIKEEIELDMTIEENKRLKTELEKKIKENKKIALEKDGLEAYAKRSILKFNNMYLDALAECKAKIDDLRKQRDKIIEENKKIACDRGISKAAYDSVMEKYKNKRQESKAKGKENRGLKRDMKKQLQKEIVRDMVISQTLTNTALSQTLTNNALTMLLAKHCEDDSY